MKGWIVFLFGCVLFFSAIASTREKAGAQAELRSKATILFEAGNYREAAPLFSQLLSLEQNDTALSYFYGVCLVQLPKQRQDAVPFLDFARKNKRIPSDVWYYLGRAQMAAGSYTSAITSFYNYLESGNVERIKKSESKGFITNCENAELLQTKRTTVAVLEEHEIPAANFYTAFSFGEGSGRIMKAAEQFTASADKESGQDPVMYISSDLRTVYIGTHRGAGGGKDLYRALRRGDGTWSGMELVGDALRSGEDEDYVFLDKSGKNLYFSSKGFNSMGGYDIFRSEYDYSTGQWSAPVNLGIPFNSTEDDMLFVPAADGKTATYVTGDRAEEGKLNIRTVELNQSGGTLVNIKGFYKSVDQKMRRDARISVVRSRDLAVITSVHTDPRTGQYELVIPPDEDFLLVVDGGGYVPHAETFQVPVGADYANLKQVVSMNRSGNDEELKLTNYFSAPLLAAASGPKETSQSLDITRVDSTSLIAVKIENSTLLVVAPPALLASRSMQQASKAAQAAATLETEKAALAKAAETSVLAERQQESESVVSGGEQLSIKDQSRLKKEEADDYRDIAAELRADAADMKEQAASNDNLASALFDELERMDPNDKTRIEGLRRKAQEMSDKAAITKARAADLDRRAFMNDALALKADQEAERILTGGAAITFQDADVQQQETASAVTVNRREGQDIVGEKVIFAALPQQDVAVPSVSKASEKQHYPTNKVAESLANSKGPSAFDGRSGGAGIAAPSSSVVTTTSAAPSPSVSGSSNTAKAAAMQPPAASGPSVTPAAVSQPPVVSGPSVTPAAVSQPPVVSGPSVTPVATASKPKEVSGSTVKPAARAEHSSSVSSSSSTPPAVATASGLKTDPRPAAGPSVALPAATTPSVNAVKLPAVAEAAPSRPKDTAVTAFVREHGKAPPLRPRGEDDHRRNNAANLALNHSSSTTVSGSQAPSYPSSVKKQDVISQHSTTETATTVEVESSANSGAQVPMSKEMQVSTNKPNSGGSAGHLAVSGDVNPRPVITSSGVKGTSVASETPLQVPATGTVSSPGGSTVVQPVTLNAAKSAAATASTAAPAATAAGKATSKDAATSAATNQGVSTAASVQTIAENAAKSVVAPATPGSTAAPSATAAGKATSKDAATSAATNQGVSTAAFVQTIAENAAKSVVAPATPASTAAPAAPAEEKATSKDAATSAATNQGVSTAAENAAKSAAAPATPGSTAATAASAEGKATSKNAATSAATNQGVSTAASVQTVAANAATSAAAPATPGSTAATVATAEEKAPSKDVAASTITDQGVSTAAADQTVAENATKSAAATATPGSTVASAAPAQEKARSTDAAVPATTDQGVSTAAAVQAGAVSAPQQAASIAPSVGSEIQTSAKVGQQAMSSARENGEAAQIADSAPNSTEKAVSNTAATTTSVAPSIPTSENAERQASSSAIARNTPAASDLLAMAPGSSATESISAEGESAEINERQSADKSEVQAVREDKEVVMTFREEASEPNAMSASAETAHDLEVAGELSENEDIRADQERELDEVANEDPMAAVGHFEEYKFASEQSVELEREAVSLEEDLSDYLYGKDRDSLVSLINELGMESIRQWQYAEMQLRAARNADPAIEAKVKDPAYLLAAGGSADAEEAAADQDESRQGLRGRQSASPDSIMSSGDESATGDAESSFTEAPDHREPGAGMPVSDLETAPTETVTSGSVVSSVAEKVAAEDQGDASLITEQSVDTSFSDIEENVVLADASADQRYQALRKHIEEGQKRTIDLFTEGVRLNNQALKNREKQISLGLEAERTQDPLRKEQLTRQSEGFFKLSEESSNAARDRFAEARRLTDSIKEMNTQAIALRQQYGTAQDKHQPMMAKQSAVGSGESAAAGSAAVRGGVNSGQEVAVPVAPVVAVTEAEKKPDAQQLTVTTSVAADDSVLANVQAKRELAITDRGESAVSTVPAITPGKGLQGVSGPVGDVRYTVQVGVYSTPAPPSRIAALPKLRSEHLTGEVYRYSTGVFDSRQEADSMRRIVAKAGLKDAFVTIIRGGSAVQVVDRKVPSFVPYPLPVQPVDPGVLTYRIQLGAFKGKIPYSAVEGFIRIFEKGIDRQVNDAGYQVFYSGNYTTYEKAVAARDEAVAKGVKDAFIVALRDGKRVSIARAMLQEGR